MCGRYTLSYSDLDDVAEELDAILDPAAAELHRPRYNVAPTDAIAIALSGDGGRPVITPAVWGLHRDKRLLINVRSEHARFSRAQQHVPCIVPADGFYEWQGEKGERRPLWFHAEDGAPLWMAGIADAPTGEPLTFAVLTTAARPPVAAIHDRMPVLFTREGARRFLRGEPPRRIVAEDVALAARPVSSRANAVANDDPACLEPANDTEAMPRGGQLKLF